MEKLLMMWAAHFVCDYALQGDWMSKVKNRHNPEGKDIWPMALAGHCLIHAMAVYLITGSVILGCAEFVVHLITDILRIERKITYNVDQAIHLDVKIIWALCLILWL